MRVLFLEDDPLICKTLTRIVPHLGHEIVIANSIAEAKTALQQNSISLVLADIGLPNGENGEELLRWAREQFPAVRRVLTSGAMEPSLREEGLYEQFLHKPFRLAELEKLLG